ncbi:hypothetical protein KEJ15_01660 [Candidatus Bathyarchaeota archaeon]|nr:hypothetical protein [Candidatus Bathyarchaeota archaeon]
MKPKELMITLIALCIMIASLRNIHASGMSSTQIFLDQVYSGMAVKLNATSETVPGQNLTFILSITCRSLDVTVDSLNVSIYGYREGKEKTVLLSRRCITSATPLEFNQTISYQNDTTVPGDVWDTTYAELQCAYRIADEPKRLDKMVAITYVRNIYLEDLERRLLELNETYQQLWKNYTKLNETYWNQGIIELENTRRVVAILVVTTVFFIATTFYLVLKKPREF